VKIDERLEDHVRTAVGSAIAEDGERMVAALNGLTGQELVTCLGYALFATGFVLNDINPDATQDFTELATKMSREERVDLGIPELARLLAAAAHGDTTFDGLDAETVVALTFPALGYLLSWYALDTQHWYDYLDEIWAQLEAVPDAGPAPQPDPGEQHPTAN
jgi:hypothetical protein